MAKVTGNQVAIEVARVAEELGYEAKIEKDDPDFHILDLFRQRKFKPDVIVKHNNRSAIVVARSHPLIFYIVALTDQLRKKRDKKDFGALICVDDSSFDRVIGSSSEEYADDLNVRLCRLSDVGDVLKEMLG